MCRKFTRADIKQAGSLMACFVILGWRSKFCLRKAFRVCSEFRLQKGFRVGREHNGNGTKRKLLPSMPIFYGKHNKWLWRRVSILFRFHIVLLQLSCNFCSVFHSVHLVFLLHSRNFKRRSLNIWQCHVVTWNFSNYVDHNRKVSFSPNYRKNLCPKTYN